MKSFNYKKKGVLYNSPFHLRLTFLEGVCYILKKIINWEFKIINYWKEEKFFIPKFNNILAGISKFGSNIIIYCIAQNKIHTKLAIVLTLPDKQFWCKRIPVWHDYKNIVKSIRRYMYWYKFYKNRHLCKI